MSTNILSEYHKNNHIETVENDIEFYLHRYHIVVGSYKTTLATALVYDPITQTIDNEEIEINKGFVKCIEEVISNSCDVYTKTNGEFCNKMKIVIDRVNGCIELSENGSGIGIPQDKLKAAATDFKTSSNYEWKKEEGYNREGNGVNGFGMKALTLGSSYTAIESVTPDGKRGILTCKNNLSDIDLKTDDAPKSAKIGLNIKYIPDLKLFGFNDISDALNDNFVNHLHALLVNVAVTFPSISIDLSVKDK